MTLDRDLVVRALSAYDIGDEIGRGGWALVLRARHRSLGRDVAVKQLPRAFAADPAVAERFRAEARLVARLNHPHIVPVHDFVEYEGVCLLVMELMQPYSLWDRFVAHGVALDVACGFTMASAAALQYAHDQGVLHRDVKPENLLFSTQGHIKLGDFGIAKVIGSSGRTLTLKGAVIGTPAYLAPEQARGEPLDARTDVYSLGVVLYELACGALPFGESRDPLRQLAAKISEEPRDITALRPDLHPALAEVIMRSVARSRDERPRSAREMGLAIADAATEAFGAGWLRRAGVDVMAANDMTAVTERGGGGGAAPVEAVTPETTSHPRVGALAPRDDLEGAVALDLSEAPASDPAGTGAGTGPPVTGGAPSPGPAPGSSPGPAWPPPAPTDPVPDLTTSGSWAPPPPGGPWASSSPPAPGTGGWAPSPPPPSPPPAARRPASGGRTAKIALIAFVVLAGAAAGAYALRDQFTGTGSGGTTTTAEGKPVSTDTPVIDRIATTADGIDIYWHDRGWPSTAHVLLIYSTQGPQTMDTAGSPQPVHFSGKPKYCFAVAVKKQPTRKSRAECINNADRDQLVPN